MARLPRYAPLGVELAAPPSANFAAAGGAQARSLDRLSASIDKMSQSVFVQAGRAATAAGVEAGADDPAEVLKNLMTRNKGTLTAYESAAYETATKVYGAEVETKATLDMGNAVLDAERDNLDSDQLNANLQAIVDGYSGSLDPLSPVTALEVKSRLTSKQHSFYLKKSAEEIKQADLASQAEAISTLDVSEQIAEAMGASGASTSSLNLFVSGERERLLASGIDAVAIEKTLNSMQSRFYYSRASSAFGNLSTLQDQSAFASDFSSQMNEGRGPLIEGLTRKQQESLSSGFSSDLKAGLSGLSKRTTAIGSALKDLITNVIKKGSFVAPSVVEDMRIKIDQLSADGGDVSSLAPILNEFGSLQDDAVALSKAGLGDLEREVTRRGIELQDGADVLERERYDLANRTLAARREQFSNDPVRTGQSMGRIGSSTDDPSQRISEVQAFYDSNKPVPKDEMVFLSHSETDSFVKFFSDSDVSGQIELLFQVNEHWGQFATNVFSQINDENPVLAHVGGLASVGVAPSALAAALQGQKLIDEKVALRASGESRAKVDALMVGLGMMTRTPETVSGIIATADAIYVGMGGSAEDNLFDEDKYNRALSLSAGLVKRGDTEYGGIDDYNDRNIIIPNNIPNGSLNELMRGALEADIVLAGGGMPLAFDGTPIGIDRLTSNMVLETVGDGVVAVGLRVNGSTQQLLEADGMEYRLNIRELQKLFELRLRPDDPELASLKIQQRAATKLVRERAKEERKGKIRGPLGRLRQNLDFGITNTPEEQEAKEYYRTLDEKARAEEEEKDVIDALEVAREVQSAAEGLTVPLGERE